MTAPQSRAAMRFAILLAFLLPVLADAQTKSHTAAELVAGVKGAKPLGGLYVRLRMEHNDGKGKPVVLQVQLKRRSANDGASESLYQVLFPKERKGEGLLLRMKRGSISGATFSPAGGTRPITDKDRSAGVFGTALSIDDVAAEFLNWPQHEITGREKAGSIPCAIVESKPSKTSGEKTRSWIDEARFVTMRVEMFSGGDRPAKTVITHKAMRGSSGYYVPASFTVTDHATGASTKIEGVRSESDPVFTDADFSEAALKMISAPKSN